MLPFQQGSAINDSGVIAGAGTAYFQNTGFVNDAVLYQNGTATFQPYFYALGGYASEFTGINDSGQIVELYGSEAFLYSGGQITILGTCAGGSNPAIDASGQVALTLPLSSCNGDSEAYVYSNGSLTPLGTLGASSAVYGINDSGVAVGYSQAFNGEIARAAIFENGIATDLNTLVDPSLNLDLTDALA